MLPSEIVLENDIFKSLEDDDKNKVDELLVNLREVVTVNGGGLRILSPLARDTLILICIFFPPCYLIWLLIWLNRRKHRNELFLILVFKSKTGDVTERAYFFERENKEKVKKKIEQIKKAISNSSEKDSIEITFSHKDVIHP